MFGVEASEYWQYCAQQASTFYTIDTGFMKPVLRRRHRLHRLLQRLQRRLRRQGVGRACTEAFVASFVVILIMNFFLAMLLNTIYQIFWPGQQGIFT